MKVTTASASTTVPTALIVTAASIYVSTGDGRLLVCAAVLVITRLAAAVVFITVCACLPAERRSALMDALRCWRRD